MKYNRVGIINKYKIILVIKILLSICLIYNILYSIFIDGLRPYQSYKDYDYQNDFSVDSAYPCSEREISQTFIAKGNLLNNVSIYWLDGENQSIEAVVYDQKGNHIEKIQFDTAEFKKNSWNDIGLSIDKLKRDQVYTITFTSDKDLDSFIIDNKNSPVIFGDCSITYGKVDGSLAISFHFTYTYLTLGSVFEIIAKVLFSLLFGGALCYSIFNIEELLSIYNSSAKKTGLLYAAFFACSTAMLFDPMDSIRNLVSEFNRIIGSGIVSNVDVSKRISNFNYWYILFGVTFVLFYLLFNALHQKEKNEESKKVQYFLDDFIILANCSLLLKIINFFQSESGTTAAFRFSEYVMLLVMFICIAYIFLGISEKIPLEQFWKICFIGASLSYPLMIVIALEWDTGSVLLGVLLCLAIAILVFTKITGKCIENNIVINSTVNMGVIILSFVPLMTSLYIELIHIMNQWGAFVAHPAKYYLIAVIFGLIFWIVGTLAFKNKEIRFPYWKSVAFPIFAFGITCLANQITISNTYNSNIYEGANAGILISDFLNFGMIPNVEHYGGHMMTGVWEGILYGFINRDFAGAFVSPYSSLLAPFLSLLFYYMIKAIWNEDMALFTTLLFPFYSSWSYYGLGMLICIAAMAYVKNHTYKRAFTVWGAFIWCAFYRLDLGFAFGGAMIISMAIYCIANKDQIAAKQLSLSLIFLGLLGSILWGVLCIIKGIDPIDRLFEFLMVNLSNQNWAFTGIGDISLTRFSWAYITIPFLVVISLVYVSFSKNLRFRIGFENWILLLIFGWSYFFNFSRGLVRHSLAENGTTIVIWCGYVFLSMVLSCLTKSKKVFLPSLLLLILCNTLFLNDYNFNQRSILDSAVTTPASIVESWKLGRFDEEGNYEKHLSKEGITYFDDDLINRDKIDVKPLTFWEQLKKDKIIVERVNLSADLQKYTDKFSLINKLLNEDETFADFINKTLLYCILGRKCPVYISQSPLQLSGEFMQERFIEEIEGTPIVLMPAESGYMSAISLDGITNAYRYYKVAEYIYQNYIPLYKYGEDYSVWCLPERYEEYTAKLSEDLIDFDYADKLEDFRILKANNAYLYEEDRKLVILYNDIDPMIMELQSVIDVTPFIGKEMTVSIEYETDIAGPMQLFYTTESGENYNGEKVATVNISEHGIADFVVPITEHTRLRLDTPERSKVKIISIRVHSSEELITYGYDGPTELVDKDGAVEISYHGANHRHNLSHLPRLWAEGDVEKANDNLIVSNVYRSDKLFILENTDINRERGNYLKITTTYDGNDVNGLFENDDEYLGGTIAFGEYKDGYFKEKYCYDLTFMEGKHDYLIRCSTDYYWFSEDINAIQIRTNGDLREVEMYLLEGD